MKGIMFTAKGRTEIIDEEMPVCADNTVLLRTLYSGLSNGTERSFLVGGSYGSGKWPQRIGYQHVAEVVECGSNVSKCQRTIGKETSEYARLTAHSL